MLNHDSTQCERRARLSPVIQPATRKSLREAVDNRVWIAGPGTFEAVGLLVVLAAVLFGMGLLP